ncbi:MAG: class I SAM-dependent methyltransferase [Planctomycetaceae bacterium]|nr:class I SAM-dependent methyltransferase [Planctomycetaceae bacterium]
MRLSEGVLFHLAKRLYHTGLAHSADMKEALSDDESFHQYRRDCLGKVLVAAEQYGVDIRGRDVLDLGCSDGALTPFYVTAGARHVTGVDIDEAAVRSAEQKYASETVDFSVCDTTTIPLPGASYDCVMCYDVFEHVANPAEVLAECCRVLKPGGKMLIGTWGWYHPFAPHLWSTMPVPWAHLFFSESTVLRTCRRVYQADWYVPNMHDFAPDGTRIADKYTHESISKDYLNKYLISDFEAAFRKSGLRFTIHPQPFGSKWASWTRCLLGVPLLREFITSYIWVVLERPSQPAATGSQTECGVTPNPHTELLALSP